MHQNLTKKSKILKTVVTFCYVIFCRYSQRFKRKKTTKKAAKNAIKTTFKPAQKNAIFCELSSDPRRSKSQQAQNGARNPKKRLKNAYFIEGRRIYRRREFTRKNGVLWPFYGTFAAVMFFIVSNFANAARSLAAAGVYAIKKTRIAAGLFLLVFRRVFAPYVAKQRGEIGYV